MLFISYQGIFDGNDFENANTPKQIGKALSAGFSVAIDVWKEGSKFYLGSNVPETEVLPTYFKGNKFWLNSRNAEMTDWLNTQPTSLYPNYYSLTYPIPEYVTASNGKLITFGVKPINNSSVIYLPEVEDTAMFSMVSVKCFGIISAYLTFIRRMRNEGIWY
jgi:hypothetical protein